MELVIPLAALGLAIAGCVGYFSKDRRIKRALRKAKRYTVEAFPDGSQGKIAGTLRLGSSSLRAPLSGRTCAYFCVHVEQHRSGSNDGDNWSTLIREEKGVDFIIDDGTGRALVDVAAAKTVLTIDHKTESGSFDDATPQEEAFLNAHSEESKGWLFNRRLRYREGVLEAGEEVAVFGYGIREPDPTGTSAGGYRSAAAMRLRMSGTMKYPGLISDVPSTMK